MDAVDGENRQNREIRDEERPVEPGKLIYAVESVVEETTGEAVQSRSGQKRG
jgi:hypothetical protein